MDGQERESVWRSGAPHREIERDGVLEKDWDMSEMGEIEQSRGADFSLVSISMLRCLIAAYLNADEPALMGRERHFT